MKRIQKIALLGGWFFPLIAAAATVGSMIQKIKEILNQIIPVLMILATIVFLWGVIVYITAAGDEERLKSGRTYIIYGLIGLFVMVAIWGLVRVLVETFGVGGTGIPGGPGQI